MTDTPRRLLAITYDVTNEPALEAFLTSGLAHIVRVDVSEGDQTQLVARSMSEWLTQENLRLFIEHSQHDSPEDNASRIFVKLLEFNLKAANRHKNIMREPAISRRLDFRFDGGIPAIHVSSIIKLAMDDDALSLIAIDSYNTAQKIMRAWADELERQTPDLAAPAA